jgi:hypothetical protein
MNFADNWTIRWLELKLTIRAKSLALISLNGLPCLAWFKRLNDGKMGIYE